MQGRVLVRVPAVWFVAGLALIVPAAWFLIFPLKSSVISDDGAYAIQAIALDEGDWSAPHVVASVDPQGRAYPYVNSAVTSEGFFPGGRHAIWSRLSATLLETFGASGLRFPPVLGYTIGVLASASIAQLVGGREARIPAALLALLSPLLFNALQLWAHTVAAGAVGAAMWAALRLMSSPGRPQLVPILVGVLGAAVAASVRGEGLIFALAVAAVVTTEGLRTRGWWTASAGAVIGVGAVFGYLASSAYAISVVGRSAAAVAEARGDGAAFGRAFSFVQTFVDNPLAPGPLLLSVLALGFVVAGSIAYRNGDAVSVTALFGLAAAVWVVRILAFPEAMASGILGAWPIAGILLARRWRDLGIGERQLMVMVALAATGVALTQYDVGGGVNWGGRFLSPAVPALCAVLATAIVKMSGRSVGRSPLRALAGLAIVLGGAAMVFDGTQRVRNEGYIERALGTDSQVIVTESFALPRLAWRSYPVTHWLMVPDDGSSQGAADLRRMIREADISRVALVLVGQESAEVLSDGEVPTDVGSTPVIIELGSD